MISEDSTLKDEIRDEVDEGFVDESTALSSISEDLLTVGVGATEEEEKKDVDEEEEEEPEDEVHMFMQCISELPLHNIRLILPPVL